MYDILAFVALLLLLTGAGWRRASSVASSAASFTVASRDLALFPLVFFGGEAIRLSDMPSRLHEFDAVISCTASSLPLVDRP